MATKRNPNQAPIPCSDEELLAAVHAFGVTREARDLACELHTEARQRLVAALESRGIRPGVIG